MLKLRYSKLFIIAAVLIGILTMVLSNTVLGACTGYILGDVNFDNDITSKDALLVFKIYLGFVEPSECEQSAADMNQDGEITSRDALRIFKIYLEIGTSFSGTVYRVSEGGALSAVSGCYVGVDGAPYAKTDSDGNFSGVIPSGVSASTLTFGASDSIDVYATAVLTDDSPMYVLLQESDPNENTLNTTIGKVNRKALDTTLTSEDGSSSIRVSEWDLGTSVKVYISTWQNPNVPYAVKSEEKGISSDGVARRVIGGADITLKKQEDGKSISHDDIDFSGKVYPETTTILGDISGSVIQELKGSGMVGLTLWYYAPDETKPGRDYVWQSAGAATIEYDSTTGKYSLEGGTGIYMIGLYPYVFAMTEPVGEAEITGIVTDISGDSISGALVYTDESMDTTDSGGNYSLKVSVPYEGTQVQLCAKKFAYKDTCVSVTVTAQTPNVPQNIVMGTVSEVTKATIQGTVRDESATLIEGAEVTLSTPSVLNTAVVTNTDGDKTIVTGADDTATYTWNFKHNEETSWHTLKEGQGANTLTGTEIITTIKNLITSEGYNYYAGKYDLEITVTHTCGLVETATGIFEVTISEDAVSYGSGLGDWGVVAIWGGQDKGFFYASAPPSDTGYSTTLVWSARVEGTFNGNDTTVIPEEDLSTSSVLWWNQVKGFISDNFSNLLVKFDGTTTYLEDGASLLIKVTAAWTVGGEEGTDSDEVQYNIQGIPQEALMVTNIEINPPETLFYKNSVLTDVNGQYIFVNIDPELSGCLEIRASKEGYIGSEIQQVTTFSAGEVLTVPDLYIKTELAEPPDGNETPTVVTASASPDKGKAPLTVKFTAVGSDSDGYISGYTWDFGDGTISTEQNPTHVYHNPGTYTATVTITDDDSAPVSASLTITVEQAVAPVVTLSASPSSGAPPLEVTFTATANQTITKYEWDFTNDGTYDSDTGTTNTATYPYTAEGTYTAKVRVTGDSNLTATATTNVVVKEDAGILGLAILGTISTPAEMDSYTFTANAGDVIIVGMAITDNDYSDYEPDAYIRVYDPDGKEVSKAYKEAGYWDYTAYAEVTSPSLTVTGTYTILASEHGGNSTGNYSLFVQRVNNPVNATPDSLGQTFSGSISASAEMDTYTFTANAGDVIIVGMAITDNDYTDYEPDAYIRIYDPNGAEVSKAYKEAGYWDYTAYAEVTSPSLTTTGTYTILASEYGGNSTGNYSLFVQRLNNPVNAIPGSLGQAFSGSISASAEMDTYTFTANAGDVIIVGMAITDNDYTDYEPDAYIRIYDPDGKEVSKAYKEAGYWDYTAYAEVTSPSLTVTGTYTILASEYGGNSTGDYSLFVQRLNNP